MSLPFTFSSKLMLSLLVGLWVTIGLSCVTNKKDDSPQAKLTDEEEKKLEDLRAETEVGRNMAGRLLAFYGVYENKTATGYVNQVGQYVASFSDYPDRRYMFALLDTDSVNAFACPGGYILLTVGSIRRAQNEAELAAILGHEVTHVGKQHMLNTLKSMNQDELNKRAAEAEKEPPAPASIEVRKRPKAEQSEFADAIVKVLGSANGAGFGILQAAKAGMNVILEKGLDQKLEYEADHEGVRYAIRAGYDPAGLNNFLSRLEKEKKDHNKDNTTAVLDKTHPPMQERQAKINELLAEMSAKDIVGAQGTKRFLKINAAVKKKK